MCKKNVKKLVLILSILVIVGVCTFTVIRVVNSSKPAEPIGTPFNSDVIYQIVTDRFVDGDSDNNPSGAIYDDHEWGSEERNNRLYHGGDWQGIIDKIEDGYLEGMGVTSLWISSPVENIDCLSPADGSGDGAAASYHGYWAKDFFRTNPYFGTMSDFEELIKTAHKHGIKIVIDFAPNHTSTTTDYAAPVLDSKYPDDGALYRDGELLGTLHNDADNNYFHHLGGVVDWNSPEEVQTHSIYGLADLNQENPVIDTYFKEAIDMWLDMGVDGIRVDTVKHMSFDWQQNWVSSIHAEHNVFVFGEWFSDNTYPDSDMIHFANESGMSLLDFSFANTIRNVIGKRSQNMRDLRKCIVTTEESFADVNSMVTFIDNHDISRFMNIARSNTSWVDTALVILLTQRGVPNIYYGTEQYLSGSADPENRKDMTSFDTTTNAYRIISKLSALRKRNSAIGYGTNEERYLDKDVYVYERKNGNSVVLVAVNRSTKADCSLTGLVTALPAGTYEDVLEGMMNGGQITVDENGNVADFTLGVGACAVWEYTADGE